jgi:hypothetical protein
MQVGIHAVIFGAICHIFSQFYKNWIRGILEGKIRKSCHWYDQEPIGHISAQQQQLLRIAH